MIIGWLGNMTSVHLKARRVMLLSVRTAIIFSDEIGAPLQSNKVKMLRALIGYAINARRVAK